MRSNNANKKKESLAAKIQSSLYEFLLFFYQTEYPTCPLKNVYEVKEICDVIQKNITRLAQGKRSKRDLSISITNSSLILEFLQVVIPVWTWLQNPYLSTLSVGFNKNELSLDLVKSFELTQKGVFQETAQTLPSDSFEVEPMHTKKAYTNNKGGTHTWSTIQRLYGNHGDVIISDLRTYLPPQKENIDSVKFLSTRKINRRTSLIIYFVCPASNRLLKKALRDNNTLYRYDQVKSNQGTLHKMKKMYSKP